MESAAPSPRPTIEIPREDFRSTPPPPQLPPVQTAYTAEEVFTHQPVESAAQGDFSRGEEIRFDDPPASGQEEQPKGDQGKEEQIRPDDPDLVSLESLFSPEEIEELLVMIWQDGGNFFLRRARKELISDAEALKLGKISMMCFKKRFGNKIQAIPELYLICYFGFVIGSKEKLDPGHPDYVPPKKHPTKGKAKTDAQDAETVDSTINETLKGFGGGD